MNAKQSIKQNLNYYFKQLQLIKSVKTNDPIEKLNKVAGIKYYRNEMEKLEFLLKNVTFKN